MTQSSANVVLMAAPAKPSGGDLPPADTARRASPFRDGYDIEGAREHLEDLQENPDPTDPRWPQLVELEEREDMLRRMQARAKEREGAEPVVPDKEARAIREVGKLVSEETDTMTLHTKDAYRLFIGKVKTDKKVYPFVGGERTQSNGLQQMQFLLCQLDVAARMRRRHRASNTPRGTSPKMPTAARTRFCASSSPPGNQSLRDSASISGRIR